jgi:hypothetical protein
METARNLPTPSERMAQSELIELVFKSERSRDTFLSRMAQNRKFAEEKKNLHSFFVSLDTFKRIRGYLTDKQKAALERECRKYAPYLMTLRVARPAVEQNVAPVEIVEIDEDAPLDDSQAEQDEREGMVEA